MKNNCYQEKHLTQRSGQPRHHGPAIPVPLVRLSLWSQNATSHRDQWEVHLEYSDICANENTRKIPPTSVIYCCVINYPKTWWCWTTIILLPSLMILGVDWVKLRGSSALCDVNWGCSQLGGELVWSSQDGSLTRLKSDWESARNQLGLLSVASWFSCMWPPQEAWASHHMAAEFQEEGSRKCQSLKAWAHMSQNTTFTASKQSQD